jgi:hypothetical protein
MVNKLKKAFLNYERKKEINSTKRTEQLDIDSLGKNNYSYRSRTEGKASKVNPSSTSKTKPTPRSSKSGKPTYNLLFR